MAGYGRRPRNASIALTKANAPRGHLLSTFNGRHEPTSSSSSGEPQPPRKSPGTYDDPLSSSEESDELQSDVNTTKPQAHPPPRPSARKGPRVLVPPKGHRNWNLHGRSNSSDVDRMANGAGVSGSRTLSTTDNTKSKQSASGAMGNQSGSPKRQRMDTGADQADELDDEFGAFKMADRGKKPKRRKGYGTVINIHAPKPAGDKDGKARKDTGKAKKDGKKVSTGFKDPFENRRISDTSDHSDPELPGTGFKSPPASYLAALQDPPTSSQDVPSFSQGDEDTFKVPAILPDTPENMVSKRAAERYEAEPDESPGVVFRMPASMDIDMSQKDASGRADVASVAKDVLRMTTDKSGSRMSDHPPASSSESSKKSTLDNNNTLDSPPDSLSPPPYSPERTPSPDHQHDQFPSSKISSYLAPVTARCPLCGATVDINALDAVTNHSSKRLNVRQQAAFCRAHKHRSALQTWSERGYPRIDWAGLPARLSRFHSTMARTLSGTRPSFYRAQLEQQQLRSGGASRTMAQSIMTSGFARLTPGYYGSRGARAMTDFILHAFSPALRRLAHTDPVISSAAAGGGVSGYVQAVLVPELAALLVAEDLGCAEDRAREVLEDSIEIGDLVNEEVEEDYGDDVHVDVPVDGGSGGGGGGAYGHLSCLTD
ncbi:MAG: hypothetical protein M1819_001868 [Sarea resinae]|nr:MAG: hypothetical protein M1819_001868 [Sarea resinae]